MISFLRRLIVLLLAGWLMQPQTLEANEPPWGNEPFGYVIVEQDLAGLLLEFAAHYGIPISISERVQGVVRGRLPPAPPRAFLDNLARIYGLLWYYDGFVLHISAIDEAESHMIKLDTVGIDRLTRSLNELGVLDRRFPWRVSPSMDVIFVSGPSRYVELVRATAGMLQSSQAAEVVIRAFKLRYAQAEDRAYSVRGRQVVLPGLASVLRRVAGVARDERSTQDRRATGERTITRIHGDQRPITTAEALGVLEAEGLAIARAAEGEAPALAQSAPLRGDTDPQIESDPRTNTIIIKDLAGRMPIYERLIAELDRAQRLIEVEVVIADITTDRLQDIGVDWRLDFDSNNVTGSVGIGNPAAAALSQGLSFATAISGDPFSVLSRIRALEEVGDARVISRPSVLTFDNVEAAFDQNQTFFVRLEGNEAVELVEVEVGLLLQVKPQVVEDGSRPRVQMTIEIEDGTASQEQVDDLPVLLRSTINTQGMVLSGQALVIGGFYRQSQIDNLAKVPLLGDIPLVGWLFFTNRQQQDVNVTRLFVIRPLVIDEREDALMVSGTTLPREGPLALVPSDRRAWLTPERTLQQRAGELNLDLDRRVTRLSMESLCLTRAMQNDPCPPGLIQLLSDVQLLPPRALSAEPADDPVAPGELY